MGSGDSLFGFETGHLGSPGSTEVAYCQTCAGLGCTKHSADKEAPGGAVTMLGPRTAISWGDARLE